MVENKDLIPTIDVGCQFNVKHISIKGSDHFQLLPNCPVYSDPLTAEYVLLPPTYTLLHNMWENPGYIIVFNA